MAPDGYSIVLTADRTLMSEYNGGIFLGFSACVPTGLIPDRIYFSIFSPSVPVKRDGSAELAPCGTRKIEAALLNYGFSEEDIIVAHPDFLHKVVGPKTRVIGITENDPLGIGPATSTFTEIFGGEAYMAIKFREILANPSIKKFRPKIIVGGPGAWQLEEKEVRRRLGIDTVVIGEGDKNVGLLFEKAMSNELLPEVLYGEVATENDIPIINGPTIDGIVEIARGCGRGCKFCVPTLQTFRYITLEHILREVNVNLRSNRRPLLHAEDVLRYGAKRLEVNKRAVIKLFREVRNNPGVNNVAISHFSLSSVASAPEVVEEISNILDVTETKWYSGQTGIETGSPDLMKRYMSGKCKPFSPEDWPQVVVDAFEILSDNNWVPCATLILGFSGETDKDLGMTLSLLDKLRPFKSLIVPLFLVAMGGLKTKTESLTMGNLTRKQCEVLIKSWEHSLHWAPFLFEDWARMSIRNKIASIGLRFFLSYGIKKAKNLTKICREEYDYNLSEMIKDYKNGQRRLSLSPLTIMNFMSNLSKGR